MMHDPSAIVSRQITLRGKLLRQVIVSVLDGGVGASGKQVEQEAITVLRHAFGLEVDATQTAGTDGVAERGAAARASPVRPAAGGDAASEAVVRAAAMSAERAPEMREPRRKKRAKKRTARIPPTENTEARDATMRG